SSSFMLTLPQPLRSTHFPYTTLFRSPYDPDAQSQSEYAEEHERPGLHDHGPTLGLGQGSQGVLVFLLGWNADHLRLLTQIPETADRKSTRLNSSHEWISYAVFCLKTK